MYKRNILQWKLFEILLYIYALCEWIKSGNYCLPITEPAFNIKTRTFFNDIAIDSVRFNKTFHETACVQIEILT